MKVYIIGYSDYEGFDIRAIAPTAEEAQRYVDTYHQGAEIEEHDTEQYLKTHFNGELFFYHAVIYDELAQSNGYGGPRVGKQPTSDYQHKSFINELPRGLGRYYSIYTWARDEAHALEILQNKINAEVK